MRAFLGQQSWLIIENGQNLAVDDSIQAIIDDRLLRSHVMAEDFVYLEINQVERILRVYSGNGDLCPILLYTSRIGEYTIAQVGTVAKLVKTVETT